MTLLTWLGIVLCITQSGTLSGLNLACFNTSRMRLELQAKAGNPRAAQLLKLREDSNFLLATILWGNVAVNVMLALLSGSVMVGVAAFLFSTVVITIVGEIIPQAYFSRHALTVAARLYPVLRFWQFTLYPVAKPTALVLDRWLGPEAISYYGEDDLQALLAMHASAEGTEIDRVEGLGALNFLALDDVPLAGEGEPLDPRTLLTLPFEEGRPVFPSLDSPAENEFLRHLARSGLKWAVITDPEGQPKLALNIFSLTQDALYGTRPVNPMRHCHRPVIAYDGQLPLGQVIGRFKVHPERANDDVIDQDVILVWAERPRIITGSDLLGRLLRGIVQNRIFQQDALAITDPLSTTADNPPSS
ncbi:MAG: DUF21 domain-containing protein [Marinobacter sp.]|nr:DUF21 domain-containing protein [Marinobacter sp.]